MTKPSQRLCCSFDIALDPSTITWMLLPQLIQLEEVGDSPRISIGMARELTPDPRRPGFWGKLPIEDPTGVHSSRPPECIDLGYWVDLQFLQTPRQQIVDVPRLRALRAGRFSERLSISA